MSVINFSPKIVQVSGAFGKYRKLHLGILRSGNKGIQGIITVKSKAIQATGLQVSL